jgi:6-hydroxytryprostatin B O-methyltransferase
MRAISGFRLYENVPAFGSAAFEEIASKTQLPLAVGFMKTILRYARTNGIFCEPSPGHVSHTGLSFLLLKDPLARVFVSNNADGVFPSTTKVVEALRKWSEADGPNHTGLQLACRTEKSMFEWYAGIDEAKANGNICWFNEVLKQRRELLD